MLDKVNEILEDLNDEQRLAVTSISGPILIVAGAGSGKTRVLTSRIAYLLAKEIAPQSILSLTFTKKAASEMKERIAAMVGESRARHLVMGTFHAVFVRILRDYADVLGYDKRFTIYDTADSLSALRLCIKELNLDDKLYKPKEILSRISMAKNNLITAKAYRNDPKIATNDAHSKKPRMGELYELYQAKLKQSGVMDFDDILLNMNILLRDSREALEQIASRYTHIMVDEYQDTNYSQYLILKRLAQAHHNICVVGDDSQSIYAFRGAKIENILNFRKDYPECKTIRLERNYRSTQMIVDAANSVIAHNSGRIPKNCYSEADKGEKIRLLQNYTETEEALSIVQQIVTRMQREHCQYQDFAILYRTNAQSRVLEEQLRRRNIPYMIYSGNSFFDRMEVKDMMSYFKLCVNTADNESFRRVVNKPARGIGATSLAALDELARSKSCTLFEAAQSMPKIQPFCAMIQRFADLIPTADAYDMARTIAVESGLLPFYQADSSIEGLTRVANLEELINSVQAFVEDKIEEAELDNDIRPVFTLDDYLEDVSLLSNIDTRDDETNNKVALMTVHSAKGLEFPYVFVAGMEENLFPSLSMVSVPQDIEEERRLFYVALTRAQKSVMLSFADTRMRNGRHESNTPSRFIREIDKSYVENPLSSDNLDQSGVRHEWGGFGSRATGARLNKYGSSNTYGQSSRVSYSSSSGVRPGSVARPSSVARPGSTARPSPSNVRPVADADFVPSPMTAICKDQRVEHKNFGIGTVLELSGQYPDIKAHVRFDEAGTKLLLLRYAKLRIVQ